MITSDELAARCREDPEFRFAARFWTGGFSFATDGGLAAVRLVDGNPEAGPVEPGPGVISFAGARDLWDTVLSAAPPRFFNDIGFAEALGLERTGDDLTFWQYYPAVMRAVELMRPPVAPATMTATARRFDSPVGRYVHVEL